MLLKKVLIADDEINIGEILRKEFLSQKGYEVDVAYDGEEAWSQFKINKYDVLILDVRMAKIDGISLLKKIKKTKKGTNVVVILITAFGTIKDAVESMKFGAYDYITKPFDFDELFLKIEQAFSLREKTNGQSKNILSPSDITTSETIIGTSKEVLRLKTKIKKVKDLDSTVLIIGESGTGKGVVAKEIHNTSNRQDQPFVHLNCAALPANLIESELFGHEKGAFTGATSLKKGKFELAGKGTIFLDEIGTLELNLQVKLLNVLQEKCMERVGGNTTIPIQARIIAATNSNLEEAVRQKTFREDLYYRLNVITIECLPLRFIKEDIKPLVWYFLHQFNQKFNKEIDEISFEVWEILKKHDWPGNVRELENTIESAVALSTGKILYKEDLPLRLVNKAANHSIGSSGCLISQEIETIKQVLEKYGGHREKTAKELGISKRTLQNKLNKFGLR